jgi:hypothetical protein
VSDYGRDDRATEVGSPAEAKDFSSSLCVQTSSETHPSSYPMGNGPFPGGKSWQGRDSNHSPHVMSRSGMSTSYNSSPHCRLHGCSETAWLLLLVFPNTDRHGSDVPPQNFAFLGPSYREALSRSLLLVGWHQVIKIDGKEFRNNYKNCSPAHRMERATIVELWCGKFAP